MNIPHQTKLEYFQCPRVRTFQMSISKTTVILSMSEINRNVWMMLKYIKNKKKRLQHLHAFLATWKIICTAVQYLVLFMLELSFLFKKEKDKPLCT